MNIVVPVSLLPVGTSSRYMPKRVLLDLLVVLCPVFRGITRLISRVVVQVCNTTSNGGVFLFLHIFARNLLTPEFFSFFWFFETGFSVQPWLSWNSLCRPGWCRTQKSACLCLPPSAGINKRAPPTPGFKTNLKTASRSCGSLSLPVKALHQSTQPV